MTGENFVEVSFPNSPLLMLVQKDLVMIVSICPEAYLLKSSSSGGVSISINTLWPPRPHATGKASHVAAESRLTEFRSVHHSLCYLSVGLIAYCCHCQEVVDCS
jgi:hypothetical protein